MGPTTQQPFTSEVVQLYGQTPFHKQSLQMVQVATNIFCITVFVVQISFGHEPASSHITGPRHGFSRSSLTRFVILDAIDTTEQQI